MKSFNKIALIFFWLISLMFNQSKLNAHSVQIAYCIDCSGNLRIFVEHWHGTENPSTTNMTIDLTIAGSTTTQTQPPAFGLIDVPFASLPGCVTPITSVAGCSGQMNTYNDWVIYDYSGLPTGVPIAFTIISGNNAFTSDGCGMYPLTVNFTIPPASSNALPVDVCVGQLTPAFNVPPTDSWTNSNPAIGLPASGTGSIAPFLATTVGTSVVTYTNNCGVVITTLNIIPSLISTFTDNSGSGVCLGVPVSFNDTSPVAAGWLWDFGDGNSSTLQNPLYVYPNTGTYTVSLTVTSGTICPGTSTQVVTINPLPVPAFTLTPTCDNTPTVSIMDGSTIQSGTLGYQWAMNAAFPNTSTLSNPIITYSAAGNYTVGLTLTSGFGCISNLTHTVTIYPKPTIFYTANSVCKGMATTFVNTSSVSLPNSISNWYWDFDNDNVTDNTTLSSSNSFLNDGVYPVELKGLTNNGCQDSLLLNVVVHSIPTVSFSALNNCPKVPIVLGNTSSINAPSTLSVYAWSFGSGSSPATSSLSIPTNITYTTSGIKTITLSLSSNHNCTATATQTIQVYVSPTASFNANAVCSGTSTNFTDLSLPTNSISSWAWDFDNNTTIDATTQNPSNLYSSSGNPSVTLIVSSNDGCNDTLKKAVTVYGRSVINFGPTSVCFNTPTAFTNSTSTTINPNTAAVSSWSWNFGALAGSSTLQNPVYTYTNPANATVNTTYSATLYATTANGCKDSITKSLTVYSLPSSDFISDSVCYGSPTNLLDASNTNGNPFFLFSWDFNGDNVSDLTNNSISSTYTFPNPGSINVTYTVITSPNGGLLTCSNKITKTVWVNFIPSAVITSSNKCLDAQPVPLSGINSTIAVGTLTNYAWDYGNGNTNLVNPTPASSYSYNTAGNYIVTLTVTSSAGCTNSATQAVDVWERPYANISSGVACVGRPISLTSNELAVSAPITNYEWDFNNSPSSIEASGSQVSYTFTTAGIQTVNLVVTSNQGCKNTFSKTIYINYNPKPNFYAPKRAGCSDLCIPIIDSTQAIPGPSKNSQWEWNFGASPSIQLNQSGTQTVCFSNTSNTLLKYYNLKLIVRTDSGCVDSISKLNYVKVYPNPKADFEWVGKDGTILTPFISFQNTSLGYSNFWWYFNDEFNVVDSVNNNPMHNYNADVPRSYNVFLAVRNQYGCKDTINKNVDINPEYTFYIPNTFTPDGDGVNETFTGYGIGVKGFKMWIYDRWGEMLYYTEDIKKGWDATVKGQKNKEKEDVYTYKVIVTDLLNKQHNYTGHVTLLK